MHPLTDKIKTELLPFVLKPGRYVGNELGAIKKEYQDKLKVALVFPDVYEIGMSYQGILMLYHIINQREDALAERAFSPWEDAEKILREKNIPLFSLESFAPLKEFDLVGFSLAYELNYTTVLNCLDLAQIPVFSRDRKEDDPIIIAGGLCCYNPEPMASFIDVFAIGDGEETVQEILDKIIFCKKEKMSRAETISHLSQIKGVYVPSLYKVEYSSSGEFEKIALGGKDFPEKIEPRIVAELKKEFYPHHPIVPFVEITQDRLTVEIMRGCPRGCRFCNAGALYLPKRERSISDILQQVKEGIAHSGWDEVSLLSLSSPDYQNLSELLKNLQKLLADKKVSISLPSMRPGAFNLEIAEIISSVKKSGLTFAPEAGTKRLRQVIGKNIEEKEILESAETAFSHGWNLIKLYFMIALPTETEEDLKGIVDLIGKIVKIGKKYGGKNINVTISPFSPKPHTPFQWEQQAGIEEIQQKYDFLKNQISFSNVNMKYRDTRLSFLEGILSRGDRKLGKVIYSAWKNGSRLDGWSEFFDFSHWEKGFKENNISPEEYIKPKSFDQPLPWDLIGVKRNKEYLWREKERGVNPKELLEEKPVTIPTSVSPAPVSNFSEEKNSFGRRKKRKTISVALQVAKSKVRLRWSKEEKVKFTSHLDVVRMMDRTIRRGGIPIAYSEGFHPHEKIAFGTPLPLGFVSDFEYLDIQLTEPYSENILSKLNQARPPGFKFLEAKVILGKSRSLSAIINRALYEVELDSEPRILAEKINRLLNEKEKIVKRISPEEIKEVDIRPKIHDISLIEKDGKLFLKMLLEVGSSGYVRPEEVLIEGLGLEKKDISGKIIKRIGLFIQGEDRLYTPMEIF
jgi:radical SAM family uncharacterized protein/radical SAM-linked protein